MIPQVSVIIPLFNCERFISDAIESVLNQSYKKIEIIVVDNGSTDNSYEIAKKNETYSVKVVKQNTKGAGAARNKGLKVSTGQYIQYVDADDILHPNKIASQMKLVKDGEEDVVISGRWDRFNKDLQEAKFPDREIYGNWNLPLEWLIHSWEGNGMMAQHAWLTPRKLIEKAGCWNERLEINQDGEFFSRVLMQAKAVKYAPEAKAYYRSGLNDSVSQKKGRSTVASLLYSYQLYIKNVLSKYDTEKVRHALMMNFLNFIYQHYETYPDLVDKAKKEIQNLGFRNLEVTGGKNFQKIASWVGFENTLKMRRVLKSLL